MPIPNKATWQGYKKQFGIPDGLKSGVKMGDTFEWWLHTETTLRQKKDYHAVYTEIEKLVRAMADYTKALKGADPQKFKGKTGPERQASYKAANDKVKEIFGEVSKTKATYEKLAKPLVGTQIALQKAEAAFKRLKKTSTKEEFTHFYSQEFRGINLPLQLLAAATQEAGIKRGIVGFKSRASMVNILIDGDTGSLHWGSEVYGAISSALALLASEIAGKR